MAEYIRILSIDGGGIRGILPGQVMVSLEQKLQQKSGNPDARIADYFDLIAGTSTGGILTCLYLYPDEKRPGRPLFSAAEAVNLYLQYGGSIFERDLNHKLHPGIEALEKKYSAAALEALLNKYFRGTTLAQLLKPCLITSYNISGRSTHFFTQHDAKEKEGYNYLLRDVARATSAAPTYFEPARISSFARVSYPLVDGGVFANNPAMCAYAEARQLFRRMSAPGKVMAPDMFMLSVGTGSQKQSYNYDKAKGWGALGWIQPVLDIMMSGASDTVDYQLMQLFDATGSPGNYIRISPDIGKADTEMDNGSPKNIQALKEAGIAAAAKYDAELERVAEFLVKNQLNA